MPKPSLKIFPDPSKYFTLPTRNQRILLDPTNINVYLSSKSIVSLSTHDQCLQKSNRIYWNLPRSTQSARIHRNSNKPKQITKLKYSKICPKPLQYAKSLKSCKIYPAQQKYQNSNRPESFLIQPRLLKSTQTNRNPTQSSKWNEIHSNLSWSTYTERIDHRIRILNTQAARFRQLHKQLHVAQNSQHPI